MSSSSPGDRLPWGAAAIHRRIIARARLRGVTPLDFVEFCRPLLQGLKQAHFVNRCILACTLPSRAFDQKVILPLLMHTSLTLIHPLAS